MTQIELLIYVLENLNNLKKAFSYDTNKWDVLTANCKHRYYDIWALKINKEYFQLEFVVNKTIKLLPHDRLVGFKKIKKKELKAN